MDQIEKFVKDSGVSIPAYNVCFYDSNGTDEILDNILCGKKRANTGLFSLFEAQMQLLPRTGDYTVVLDSDMQPRCIGNCQLPVCRTNPQQITAVRRTP